MTLPIPSFEQVRTAPSGLLQEGTADSMKIVAILFKRSKFHHIQEDKYVFLYVWKLNFNLYVYMYLDTYMFIGQ